LVALSNGETVEAPQHFRRAERKLRLQQRRISRCKKFSQRWRKAVGLVAKTHTKIANQRCDFLHKLSRQLVNHFAWIAVEDLNINGLAQSHLAKSVHDAGWATFLMMLDHKAEEAGVQIVRVSPNHTSQACSACGSLVPKDLRVRMHQCPDCGLMLDRDVNAARNILLKSFPPGRGGRSQTWSVGSSVLREAVAF
jgi:putative transposase